MISVLFVNVVTVLFYVAFEQSIEEQLPIYSRVMLLVAAYCAAYYLSCVLQVIT